MTLQARSSAERQQRSLAVSYFYLKGTDTQPLSGSGNIPWVDRDFNWTQHNLNAADTWTLSPTMINQLKFTYTRQFGGRVNNPTTSLGDLNSNFRIQGDPTLPRLTVTGYFTGQTAIAGPDAGSDYWSIRDNVILSKGNHSFKFGGEILVREDRPRHAARQLRRVQLQRQQDRQRLRRLPAWPAGDDDAGRADSEDWTTARYFSAYAQDDYRIHPRVTLNLGLRYDLQMPLTDPLDRKLAFVPGAQITGVAERAGGSAVPRRPRHRPRHRQDRQEQHRAAARAWRGT